LIDATHFLMIFPLPLGVKLSYSCCASASWLFWLAVGGSTIEVPPWLSREATKVDARQLPSGAALAV
jgi:hypothetical protein